MVRAGDVIGAVRITQSAEAIDRQLGGRVGDQLKLPLILGGAVVLLGLAAALFLARALTRPVRALESTVQRVTAGELSARAPVSGSREQRLVAGAFNQMTERLEGLLGSQQEFVANASHQLKTPLTGLRLRLQALGKRLGEDEHGLHHVDQATHAVDHLNGIVEDLLVLSRRGRGTAAAEVLDLNAVVQEALDRWRPAAEQSGVRFHAEPYGEECLGVCDPTDLERALDALVENALAYTPRDSAVVLAASPGSLEVADEGPGLAPGEEQLIFERFRRGRAGRQGPHGTGLGLAIARELVERWGGSVTIANRPAGGAVARLSLPSPSPASAEPRDFTLA